MTDMRSAADQVPTLAALRTTNSWALVSAVRWRLRRAGLRPEEIESFSREALQAADDERREVCRRWAARESQAAHPI
jgi:hypothetical protein